jgi:hypothetical protein
LPPGKKPRAGGADGSVYSASERPDRTQSSAIAVVAACAASAGAHGALVPQRIQRQPRLGVAFIAATIVLVVLAVPITDTPTESWVRPAAVLGLATLIGAFALNIRAGIPWPADHAEPLDIVGLGTKSVEALGLAFSLRLNTTLGGARLAHRRGGSTMSSIPTIGGRKTMALAGVIAVAGATLVLAVSGANEGHAHKGHGDAVAVTATSNAKQAAFQDAMRKLWEDHVTWTRLAIVSFAHELPDLPATQARLLRNQTDIGDAIEPYYGRAAGDQLTALLEEHIVGAVALLSAAKAGDQDLIAQRTDEWYANGNEIADFLHAANPRNWSRETMREMMRGHLDQTLSEAVNRLSGNYDADVRDYDRIHDHILMMADTLSEGIIKQFPRRFR